MKLEREENESIFEHKLRLCLGKLNKDIDLDWCELVEILNETCSADHLRKMSYGYRQYNDYINGYTGVANRILSISDSHVPFQLPITTFSEYVGNVDILHLGGDTLDCYSISKFPKNYRISMMEEMIEGRQYIIDLIKYIKPKKVVINYGNHEMRFQAYLARNLDEDMLSLMPETALDLICTDGFYHYDKRNGVKNWYAPLEKVFDDVEVIYTKNWYCQIGDAIFCHPSAFSSAIMGTAKKAMDFFRNENYIFSTLVMAHTHRVGSYVYGQTTIYEQGTCSDSKKQHYTNGRLVNSQKEGFIYICQDKDGKTLKNKTKLVCLN